MINVNNKMVSTMLKLLILTVSINFLGAYSVPDVTNGLDPNGEHVCHFEDQVSKEVVVSTQEQTLTIEKYETCCKWIVLYCWRYCKKTRHKVKTRISYRKTRRFFDRKNYLCCQGWTQDDKKNETSCLKPICSIDCRNGGECIKPDTCKCKEGYDGRYCQLDINECNTKANTCEQTCINLNGGYKCACKRGYILNDDKATCSDINECDQSPCSCKSDDRCTANCKNTPGSYKCECPKGFFLNHAGQCEDYNECLSLPKDQIKCKHYCENTPGSYVCKCEKGFEGDNCTDINECLVNNGGCSDTCHNLEGSHICSCPDGFYLDKDQKNCKVINSTSFKRIQICESEGMGMVECPHLDEKIVIISAMYGRLSDQVCKTGNFKSNLRCSSKDAMTNLNSCDGLSSCVFFFPSEDPCPGVEKYYDIVYDCIKS